MTDQATHTLENFLAQRMQDGNISSTTLVVTFFCDVVTQHGGEIWLGSIVHALAPLGINDRLTRTAVFRLVKDGWLESHKQGRRSFYRLTPSGQSYYQRAARRIYAIENPDWNGSWNLLFIAMVPEEKREALKRGLSWLGFGRMAAGVYALPGSKNQALAELLKDLELEDSIVQMQARADDSESLQKLVLSGWKLDDLRKRYSKFTSLYMHTLEALQNKKPASEHSIFLLRILLIHEYRRILLSDPELPATMLPPDWEAYAARSLTAEIYRKLAPGSIQWVNRELFNADGHMKGGSSTLRSRFFKKVIDRNFKRLMDKNS
jgi:phenylacetic acid degradation operon negative regulatory protein